LYSQNPKLKNNDFTLTGSSNVVINTLKEFTLGSLESNLKQLMTSSSYLRSLDFGVSFAEAATNERLDFIKFELEASNLDSLSQQGVLQEAMGKEKSAEPTVSLHLSLLGKKLQFNELFCGYSSLLSVIWSLPTKQTSLFNVNFLVSDQNEYLTLKNGCLIRIETLGALSFDLSGVSDISMWTQVANVNIRAKFNFFFILF
jgi:hypothetical protein